MLTKWTYCGASRTRTAFSGFSVQRIHHVCQSSIVGRMRFEHMTYGFQCNNNCCKFPRTENVNTLLYQLSYLPICWAPEQNRTDISSIPRTCNQPLYYRCSKKIQWGLRHDFKDRLQPLEQALSFQITRLPELNWTPLLKDFESNIFDDIETSFNMQVIIDGLWVYPMLCNTWIVQDCHHLFTFYCFILAEFQYETLLRWWDSNPRGNEAGPYESPPIPTSVTSQC